MTSQEKQQWIRLFSMAERLVKLSPWEWMGEAGAFGLLPQGREEPVFVVFGGNPTGLRHVRFLLGWKALYDLVTRMVSPGLRTPTWVLEIPMIEMLIIKKELLFDHEVDLLQELDRTPEEDEPSIVFRSLRPGFHPWTLDEADRNLLEEVLYQTYGMTLRVETNQTLLKERFPREILMRSQDEADNWRDAWVPVKQIPDEEVEVRLNVHELEKLTSSPLLPLTLQIDLVFMPLAVKSSGGRPRTVYLLLAVDSTDGRILTQDILHVDKGVSEMWAQIPQRLVEVFSGLGGCPGTIEINSDRMANLLRPLGEMLPFKMVRREKLTTLEEVSEMLAERMESL